MGDTIERFALFAPTQAEFSSPFRALQSARQVEQGPLVIATGTLHGVETVLVRTGIGPENAAAAAERVFETFHVSDVLVAGFGGATNPDLDVGDLIGCSVVVDLTGESESRRIESSPSLIERARATGRLSLVAGAGTVARVIASAREKQDLGRKHGIVVVEMEGFPILSRSHRSGIQAIMIRAVLDRSDENLPDTTELITDTGTPRMSKILTHLAGRPSDATLFSSLRRRVTTCRATLDRFLESYLLLQR